MKPVLIVENNTSPLKMNESVDSKGYVLGGVFTEFGVKNRNERIYTADRFIPCLQELNERISTMGVVYGEFDHPDVFDTSLSRASHLIQKAFFVKENNRVDGQIRLLNTYWGKEAKALVDDGCPLFVSSRAAGITESDGTVTLKKLFTYDIVADPGFASAKLSSINESVGFTNNSNFRIYDISEDSKINDLFNMNKNEFVTKTQLTDYSKYIINEIASTRKEVKSALKVGNLSPKKLDQLLEYYDELNNTNDKIVKYLDYLAEKVQVVVNENKSLKDTTTKLITHNDYLAENLEKAINYSEYVAENLDKNISYSEYLAENLDKNISYSEYLAENLDKNISYSEYLAENLDKNIAYSEYIAENLDKNIAYSEYIAENLDKNIAYSEYIAENLDKNISYAEYLAENLDNTIAYSEYLAEHLEGNIAYSEYIAEHLDDNIAYSEYIAENLDKSVSYTGRIVEQLNGQKLFEGKGTTLPTLEEVGFEMVSDYEETADETDMNEEEYEDDDFSMLPSMEVVSDEEETAHEEETIGEHFEGHSDSELSQSIDKLIEEAKKRKVLEKNDLHFLTFLTKSEVDSYYQLTEEDKDQVKLYLNEKSYFSRTEVLRLINEALAVKEESLENKLIRLMPENIKPIWEKLNENQKKSVLSQAILYPSLDTEEKIEHFWLTRPFKTNENVNKKLVSHESLILEDKLSDDDVNMILERFKNIK